MSINRIVNLLVVVGCWAGSIANGQTIYYLETNIETFNLDGSTNGTYISTSGTSNAIAIWNGHTRIYWSDPNSLTVHTTDFDNLTPQYAWVCSDLVVSESGPPSTIIADIAVDSMGRLFWTIGTPTHQNSWQIRRSNPNEGGQPETVLQLSDDAGALIADSVSGQLYWGSGYPLNQPLSIRTSNIDGTAPGIFLENLPYRPVGFAIDHVDGKLYWCDGVGQSSGSHIYRKNLDGTGPIEIVGFNVAAVSIVIDETNRKLYWAEVRALRRSNLDGTNVEPLLDPASCCIKDFAVDFGTSLPLPPSCRKILDSDFDRDIDLGDFSVFQNCWTGPHE